MSRQPIVGADDDAWGTILNDYLSVELNTDGTLKQGASLNGKLSTSGGSMTGPLNFVDNGTPPKTRTQFVSVSGDLWMLANAIWDPTQGTSGEFMRVDNTHAAFGWQLQAVGLIPGEPDLGYYVAGANLWVAQPESYALIRNGGVATNPRFGGVGGWELGFVLTQQRQLTVGGGGIEIDGYGLVPYGRVANNQTGTVLARRLVGMMRNAYTDLSGYDDSTKESWYWGYVEQYNTSTGATVSGSTRFTVAYQPPNTSPTSGVFNELLTVRSTGVAEVLADPTTNYGIATKQYVDAIVTGKPISTPPASGNNFTTDSSGQVWASVNGSAWRRAQELVKARVHQTAAFTITAVSTMVYDTRDSDPMTLYNTAPTFGNFTCPIAGDYLIEAQVAINLAAAGGAQIAVYKAGTTPLLSGPFQQLSSSGVAVARVSGILTAAVNDSLNIEYTNGASPGTGFPGTVWTCANFQYLHP